MFIVILFLHHHCSVAGMCYVTCVDMLVVAQCVALSLKCDIRCVTCAVCGEMLEQSAVMMCTYASSDDA